MSEIPVQVHGINIVVKLLSEVPADIRVHWPTEHLTRAARTVLGR